MDITSLSCETVTVALKVKKHNMKNCTFLTGFHGVGETGYISISYLVNTLKAKRIGFIEVENPPPFINTAEKGIVTPFEIFKSKNLVLARLEFSPHRSEEAEFTKTLANWVIKEKFKDAVLIGGLDSNFKVGKDPFKIVPTTAYLPKKKLFKTSVLEPDLLVYGPLAIMLGEFEIRNFPAIGILPYASSLVADPGAAVIAIRNISKAYNVKVDVSQLKRDAEHIEVEIKQKMKRAQDSRQNMYV